MTRPFAACPSKGTDISPYGGGGYVVLVVGPNASCFLQKSTQLQKDKPKNKVCFETAIKSETSGKKYMAAAPCLKLLKMLSSVHSAVSMISRKFFPGFSIRSDTLLPRKDHGRNCSGGGIEG